jgi:peptidyl-prolyl cis-trans isomerase A (cyclophilin A)
METAMVSTMRASLTWFAMLAVLVGAGLARAQATGGEPPAADPGKAQEGSPEPESAEDQSVYVKMATSLGDIILELDRAKAPETVKNFLSYTDAKYYDGTVFHRVVRDFMIQGGGFGADLKQKKTETPIKNEWKNGLKNVRGSIAMARLGRQPDSATSQFFINVKDNGMLDQPNDGAGYAVFGKVVEGMDTVDKIRNVTIAREKSLFLLPPGRETHTETKSSEVPADTVLIQTVTRLSGDDVAALKDRLAAPAEPKPAEGDGKTAPPKR